MVAPLIRNGWEIYFHRSLFGAQRRELREKAKKLRTELSEADYAKHPDVKLLASAMMAVKEKIVINPFDAQYSLQGELKGFGRVKGSGLSNNRCRLFFKAFQEEGRNVIVVIWLGYPRKQGDPKDCYTVFKKMVNQGMFHNTMEELLKDCE